MFSKKNEYTLIKTQYQLIKGFKLTEPILIIYLLKYVSLGQIILYTAIKLAITGLFEIPSGIFADNLSKKKQVMIASTLNAIGYLLLLITENWSFFISFIFFGISESLLSGTHDVMLFEKIGRSKKSKVKDFSRIILGQNRISSITLLLSGFIAAINLKINIIITAAVWILIATISYFIDEKVKQKILTPKKMLYTFEKSYHLMFREEKTRNILLISSIFISINLFLTQYDQPILQLNNINVAYFGIIYFIINMIQGLSAKYAHIIEFYIQPKQIINQSLIILAITTILLGISTNSILTIIILAIRHSLTGFTTPIFLDYIRRLVPRNVAGSLLSFKNMIQSATLVVFGLIFKLFNDYYGFNQTLVFSGIILLLITPLLDINQDLLKN